MSRQGQKGNDTLPSQQSLLRWDNEGGAGPCVSQIAPALVKDRVGVPMGEAELEALHVRVIALENLVIALLADASDRQLELAREMAPYISPRPGFTQHRPTTHAAAQMVDLIERACRFRSEKS